jgi:hypothetical protein
MRRYHGLRWRDTRTKFHEDRYRRSSVIREHKHTHLKLKTKLRGFLVRKRTIPTERPQPADEVSANFS